MTVRVLIRYISHAVRAAFTQIQDLNARVQSSEHSAHELQGQLAAARADLGVLSRDYEQSETAKSNLQKVCMYVDGLKNDLTIDRCSTDD